MVGILNAKRIWRENREFWADKDLRLQQEIVFASTGVKTSGGPPDAGALLMEEAIRKFAD